MYRALRTTLAAAAVGAGLLVPAASAAAATPQAATHARAETLYCPYKATTSMRHFARPDVGSRVLGRYAAGTGFLLRTPLPKVNGPGGPFTRYDDGYLRTAFLQRVSGPCATPDITA